MVTEEIICHRSTCFTPLRVEDKQNEATCTSCGARHIRDEHRRSGWRIEGREKR